MKTALVVGAGKSSLFLIEYLLHGAADGGYQVVVADADAAAAGAKIAGHPSGTAVALDATDSDARRTLVEKSDVVCSLLPPTLHTLLAYDCLAAGKPLITASYVSDDMRSLDAEVRAKGLLFMCEMGLDPGIDHMSAMEIIHRIKEAGGKLTAFKSYCGGLVAPESDDNPWHYKVSWNPWNIVTAGQGGAVYREDGQEVSLSGYQLFGACGTVQVQGVGELAYYPNRDSLAYPPLYGLEDAPTFLRATLRHPDFCSSWDDIITLGLTDTRRSLDTSSHTYASWTRAVAGLEEAADLESAVAEKIGVDDTNAEAMSRLRWLGILDNVALPATRATASPAEVLLQLITDRWAMRPNDRDMVVMQHEMEWTRPEENVLQTIISTLVLKGEGGERTAMAKTVGLPMGILAHMILRGAPGMPTGVCIPTMPAVYEPVLKELADLGVVFDEEYSAGRLHS